MSGVVGFLAGLGTGCIELWLGYQPRPVRGSWSSPFFWSPLPVLLAASLILLALSLIPGRREWVRRVAMLSNLLLVLWWVPVALVGLRYHFRPEAQGTEGAYFPYFLVVPAVLVVISLTIQLKRRATAA